MRLAGLEREGKMDMQRWTCEAEETFFSHKHKQKVKSNSKEKLPVTKPNVGALIGEST